MLGVPKTTLRFRDLLEGLTELRKAVIIMFMVCYSERLEIKISKGKRCTGQSPGETRHKLPVVSPSGVIRQYLFLSSMSCDDMHGVLPIRELT